MSDTTVRKSKIWRRREKLGLSRERVAALLPERPVTSKTIERWEKGTSPLPAWRRVQLERLYGEYEESRRAA